MANLEITRPQMLRFQCMHICQRVQLPFQFLQGLTAVVRFWKTVACTAGGTTITGG